jgi:hypothetical protein
MARKARIENAKPSSVAAWSGACEKLVIASNAKRSMRAGVYFVRPPARAARRYGTAVCVNPTQTVMPRRKRVRSDMESSASSGARSISRKSPESAASSMPARRANTR